MSVDRRDIPTEFHRTVEAAVELCRDFVFLGTRRQNLGRKFFRIVFRTVAEELDVAVVPAAAEIVGYPVNDDEVIIRIIDAPTDQLDHVAVTDPGQKLSCFGRPIRVAERANAKTGDAQAILVGVEPTDRLAENLRYAVSCVWSWRDGIVDEALASIKADGVV